MLRRTSATVAPAPQNPVSPVREVAEDREPADHSFPWGLYILLTLIVLSMGGGGIATLFSLLDEKLSAGAHYAAIVLTSISAMALSAFIIKGLGDIKVNGKMLLDKIGPVGSDARNRAEKKAGLGTRSYRLAQVGQVSAALAVMSNGAMLATTLARTKTDNAELLPLAWLVANALLTSGSSLAGFVLFTALGARNGQLLTQVHKDEVDIVQDKLKAAKNEIGVLKKRLGESEFTPDTDVPTPAVATDLFRHRPSAQIASSDAASQLIGAAAETEGAAAIPTPPAVGNS